MSELSINTTQNVTISFTAAGVGERVLASILDLVIKSAYVFLIVLLIDFFEIGRILERFDPWSVGAIYIVIFLPAVFYSLVQESFWEGQTIGKKVFKIKVVKIDGYQASFSDYVIRWFFRIFDTNIMFGVIGLVTMMGSKKGQRLGDMAAGTAVITLKSKVTINSTILEDINQEYVPVYPLVIKLSDNDVRIIKETFNSALAKDDFELIGRLKDKIESVTGIKNQSGNNRDFIRTILKDYNYYTQNM